MRKFLLFCSVLALVSCSSIRQNFAKVPTLKYINSIEVPFNQEFKKTVVGGLSGIDFDSKNNLYYLISDDRSIYNDARFYTAKIHITADSLDQINFQNVIFLKNKGGQKYANWEKYPDSSIDPEEMRYNPKTKSVIWSSEGARVIAKDFTVLQNPSLQSATLEGDYQDAFEIPPNLQMKKEERGPRSNGVLEGITFNKDYSAIYTNIEEPLYEDDTQANTTKGGLIRIYKYDTKSKKNTAQYAYQLDAVAHEPNPKTSFAVNGISAILYYDTNRLLIVERSYSTGTLPCTIKVYLCDLSKATDIKNSDSLKTKKFTTATKKLILNMDALGIFTDNIEGITFGPKLSNGKQSLLFVSDNNFSDKQKTQILLFEVD